MSVVGNGLFCLLGKESLLYLHAAFFQELGEVFGERVQGSDVVHGHVHEDNVEATNLVMLAQNSLRDTMKAI